MVDKNCFRGRSDPQCCVGFLLSYWDEGCVEKDFSDARGYGDLKKRVAEVVIDELTPIRERYHELMTNPDELDKILALGSEKASEIAEPKINEMKYNIGFIT